jgi:flagellar basal body-associated protein FliL
MADEAANQAGGDAPSPGGLAAIIRLAVAVVIVAATAGGGYFTARAFSRPAKAEATTEAPAEPSEKGKEKEKEGHGKEGEAGSTGEFKCYKMDSIIANLNEPRLARYIRATVVLSIKTSDFKVVESELEANKSRIKDWMTRYLMGCTLDDVRGRDNHNRIRKEIQASLNEQLWPKQRPLIAEIFFEEFNVQ